MARTKDDTQEIVSETLIDSTADNYPMLITIAATNSPDQLPAGAMTQAMAREHVRDLQRQGFKVTNSVPLESGEVNGIFTVKVWYCLVKE